MGEGYIGEIRMFAGNFQPRSWAYCQGQIIAISSNEALFSILGTTYGGDGRTTFALPDLRGRSAVHAGTGPGLTPRRLGPGSGQATVVLTTSQLPSHTHLASVSGGLETGTGKGDSGDPVGNYIDESAIATDLFKSSGGGTVMRGGEGLVITTGNNGGGQYHENRQPFLSINYVICQFGIFPSRN